MHCILLGHISQKFSYTARCYSRKSMLSFKASSKIMRTWERGSKRVFDLHPVCMYIVPKYTSCKQILLNTNMHTTTVCYFGVFCSHFPIAYFPDSYDDGKIGETINCEHWTWSKEKSLWSDALDFYTFKSVICKK